MGNNEEANKFLKAALKNLYKAYRETPVIDFDRRSIINDIIVTIEDDLDVEVE